MYNLGHTPRSLRIFSSKICSISLLVFYQIMYISIPVLTLLLSSVHCEYFLTTRQSPTRYMTINNTSLDILSHFLLIIIHIDLVKGTTYYAHKG